MALTGTHDGLLIAMATAIAVLASYTALDLSGRVRESSGWARKLWLGTAAVAMGGGIWAMHFVAMLAFSMPGMEVAYDVGLTVLSLLVAVFVTGVAFEAMNRAGRSIRPIAAAGLFMGLGVVGMHYMGMAAMRMPATLRYDRMWLGVSVLIAIGAATAALWLASRSRRPGEKVAAALVMGAAITGMHHAGMRAATFAVDPGTRVEVASVGQTALAVSVFAATVLVLFLALIAAMFDRRFAMLAEREAEALRRSEERFRSLYRGTPLPLHSLDQDGRIEQVSDAWLALMGYSRDEVVGRPFIHFLTAESARRFRRHDWPRLMTGEALPPQEYKAATESGAFRDVVAAARVERDADGRPIHVLGGLTDVTERRRAEEALRQAQKIEAIGQLTGGIAHDFNNLLAVVIGNLDLLRRRLPGDDPKAARLLESAVEGAQRGASLTQRLLAFARRQDLRPEPVDVAQLVRGMSDLLQRSLGPMVRVEMRFPLDPPRAQVDAHQLEMALVNLAVNARDAMPGGGTIEISACPEALRSDNPFGLPPGDYVRIAVTDEGEGMDEATLARATEPFFTTKGVGKGTGLGLSMAHGLAAQSGGQLAIRSRVGVGTVVELYLPVAAGPSIAEPEPRAAAPEPADAGAPMSVLVVDDDPLVLANTAAMLEDMGHGVRLAVSGADALDQLAADGGVNLVVTDQLMPGMTGSALARRIHEDAPDLPVLIVSGFAEFGDDEAGRFPLLRKPFDRGALAEAVRRVTMVETVVPFRRARG